MRKSADAVIRMQLNSNYTLLFPNQIDWDKFIDMPADVPFSDSIVEFLNALSGSLMKDRESRLYPDVITFAYFCRKANILKLKAEYETDELRFGRGVLFHIAPSNVPVNFGYTFVVGLLAGNKNIVRVSSKQFPQVDLIIKHIYIIAGQSEYRHVAARLAFVRYDRMSEATTEFSAMANVRVIWGGDATIATIRKSELQPRAFDVCFADRYSIAVVNPKAVMAANDTEIKNLAESFYNDTYLFDQNACSAPHLIFWKKADTLKNAKGIFWEAVHELAMRKYNLQAVLSVDKLTAFYRQAVCMDSMKENMPDNYVVRTQLHELPNNIDSFRCAGGYFSEYDIDNLSEIAPIITNKYQSMAYYGFSKEELTDFVLKNHLKGLDRIVPFGETTAFSLTWDGYNLIDILTRKVTIL